MGKKKKMAPALAVAALLVGQGAMSVLPTSAYAVAAQNTVSGQVVAADGTPLAGISITGVNETDQTQYTTTTGADGSYTLPVATGGSYTLTAVYNNVKQIIRHVAVKANTSGQNFSLDTTTGSTKGSFAGHLLDANGQPLAGYTVVVQGSDANVVWQTTTDATGAYMIGGLPTAGTSLSVQDTNGNTLFSNAGSQSTHQDKTLDLNLSNVTGVVQDSDGQPVTGVKVYAVGQDGVQSATAVTGADGTYKLMVPNGTYQVTAEQDDAKSLKPVIENQFSGVVVQSDDALNPFVISTNSNADYAFVNLNLLDPIGASPNGSITITPVNQPAGPQVSWTVLDNGWYGAYEVALKADTTYTMTAIAGDWTMSYQNVQLTANMTNNIIFEQAPQGMVEGTLWGYKFGKLPGATVTLLNANNQPVGSPAITDDTGKYRFRNVPPGTYSIQINAVGQQQLTVDKLVVTSTVGAHWDQGLTAAPLPTPDSNGPTQLVQIPSRDLLTTGTKQVVLNLDGYFNGDTLTYQSTSSDPTIADNGTIDQYDNLTIPLKNKVGTTTITVTATDANGKTLSQQFQISVIDLNFDTTSAVPGDKVTVHSNLAGTVYLAPESAVTNYTTSTWNSMVMANQAAVSAPITAGGTAQLDTTGLSPGIYHLYLASSADNGAISSESVPLLLGTTAFDNALNAVNSCEDIATSMQTAIENPDLGLNLSKYNLLNTTAKSDLYLKMMEDGPNIGRTYSTQKDIQTTLDQVVAAEMASTQTGGGGTQTGGGGTQTGGGGTQTGGGGTQTGGGGTQTGGGGTQTGGGGTQTGGGGTTTSNTPGVLSIQPTAQTSQDSNDQTTVTATVDDQTLSDMIAQQLASPDNATQPLNKVVVDVQGQGDQVQTKINTSAISKIESAAAGATVAFQTGLGTLNLPVDALQKALAQLGNSTSNGQILITLSKADTASQQKLSQAAAGANAQTLVSPVDFKVEWLGQDGKTIELDQFGSYLGHTLELPAEDSNVSTDQLVAVTFDPTTGTLFPLPTTFNTAKDGHLLATGLRPGNSLYSVLESNKSFSDVTADNYARHDIETLANKLILSGMPDGTYQPGKQVTRAEFAAMLTRALGLVPASDYKGSFSDVQAGQWYTGAVEAAAQAGLIHGMGDGTFHPGDAITRDEMMVMLYSAMQQTGLYKSTLTSADEQQILNSYQDAQTVPSWAAEATAVALKEGITQGVDPNTLAPTDKADRAQSAAFLYRMLQKLNLM